MGQQEDYNQLLPQMQALQPDEVKQPNMPVDMSIQETEDLYKTADNYKVELIATDLTQEIIDALLIRAGALREAQSHWQANYNAEQDAIKLWDEKAEEGYQLQKKLGQAFRYAYRKDNRLMGRVREILKGSSHADMIQDLNDYAVLGKEYPNQLTTINYPLTELDRAATLSDQIAEILAQSNGARKDQHKFKDLRDRAFTLLKETTDDVRECGKYVFADNPNIRKQFTSQYYRRKNTKKPDNTQQPDDPHCEE